MNERLSNVLSVLSCGKINPRVVLVEESWIRMLGMGRITADSMTTYTDALETETSAWIADFPRVRPSQSFEEISMAVRMASQSRDRSDSYHK